MNTTRSCRRFLPAIFTLFVFVLAVNTSAAPPLYALTEVTEVSGCLSVDISPDGWFLLVLDDGPGDNDEDLWILDMRDRNLVDICTGVPSTPWKARFDADGRHVWVGRYYGGLVSRIDIATCQIEQTFDVGSWVIDLLPVADRRYLLIGEDHPGGNSSTQGSVQVIDTWQDAVVGGVGLHGQPGGLAVPRDGRYAYAISSNHASDTEKLYKIDALDWTAAGSMDLPPVGGSVGLGVTPDGGTVLIPRRFHGEVLVVDAVAMAEVGTVAVEAPYQVSVSPRGDHAIVLHDGLPKITVIDLEGLSVAQEIAISGGSGNWKREAAWTPAGERAFIAHDDQGLLILESCLAADVTGDDLVNVEDLIQVILRYHCLQ